MSEGSAASRSGAKPSAGPLVPATPLRPSTNGSSIRLRNWLPIWKPACCAPVAASPESCESALPRLAPVNPKIVTKPGGSVPPLLKKLLSELATLSWLPLSAPFGSGCCPGVEGCCPSTAVRFKIASVPV